MASRMPDRWQLEFKRLRYAKQINNNKFVTEEPEYKILDTLLKPGDWVIDVGANIGHYTKRFSELVGEKGRVIAFEPVPTTFSLLAANMQLLPNANVSLFNAAISDKIDTVGMSLPQFEDGITNYYRAEITSSNDSALSVLTLSIDALSIEHAVALVKIDAEGHEPLVLSGMQQLIARYHPTLIIENPSEEIINKLKLEGYGIEKLDASPNTLFKHVQS